MRKEENMNRQEKFNIFLDECIEEIMEQVPLDSKPDLSQKEDLDLITFFRRPNVQRFIAVKFNELTEIFTDA